MRARFLPLLAGFLSAAALAASCGGVNVPSLDLPAQPDPGADPAGDTTGADPAPEAVPEVAGDAGGDVADKCTSDADCEGATGGCGTVTCDKAAGKCVFEVPCDDGNPCTIDRCDAAAKACRYEPQNGGECDDGNPCTVDDGCFAGVCAGLANHCDDQNACTRDLCSPAKGGCFHEASGLGVCDDNNPCTSGDTCDGDVCAGTPTAVCDDKNPCTDDSCDPVTGKCVFMSNEAPCDDADPCTVEHACSSGKCVGTKALDCDDNEDCTTDVCVKGLGCQYAFVPGCLKCASDAECNDSNACTADYCGTGACASAPLEGAGCEDGDPCTEGDRCVGTVCAAGLPRACEDDNPCTAGECVAGTGECMQVPVPGGCDDGNACTSGDTCVSGACAGSPLACEQPGPCLSAICDSATGLCETSPLPDGSSCDDGDGCTSDDACAGGTCMGRAASCDDGDPCTIDGCTAGG
ncbi:MAG: hypothetical protein FJ087_12905, partial [Deltaproteobacteria bacterium]|nr:hypothetical protein [Deltaproteobacteria bacterium]